ncbi:hypothetical protein MIND_01266300 [Mycena indigotica]|uniref:S-adenosyl-L-methionine-dependent methyltransferase n=1 Tax=Mycena indigotica TaxID=2126181 RepID=A0A8H6VRD6_9AGAR|nr:uncharacterized protein MIND_01266300 [Mycena indigotica]KAF7291227.1 hypothetical protein MIND_01266300 [Mycena indigotica]
MEQLRQLISLISTSLDRIEDVFCRHGLPVPTLETAYDPISPTEALRLLADPSISTAVLAIVAASAQLGATFRKPTSALLHGAGGFYVTASIRTVSHLNVADILKEAGPQGMHADELGAKCKTDGALLGKIPLQSHAQRRNWPPHIARILRLLATHHIFNEVAPDTFSNNRISSALCTGLPVQDLLSRREKAPGRPPVYEPTAFIEFFSDVNFKSAAYSPDTVISPECPGQLSFNRAYGTTDTFYAWLSRPENEHLRRRFDVGMRATEQTRVKDELFLGFPWGDLPAGSMLVDVGGGVGHVTLQIAKRYPALRVVVEDLEQAAEASTELWKTVLPTHIENNIMKFQVHDFFAPQPAIVSSSNAPVVVFVLRYILHNWDDHRAVTILKRLHAAAETRKAVVPNAITKLVIIEAVSAFATRTCAPSRPGVFADSGAATIAEARVLAPEPLLPNWGIASTEAYFVDMAMHHLVGARERPLQSYRDVMQQAGWKLKDVFHGGPPVSWELSHLVGEPM